MTPRSRCTADVGASDPPEIHERARIGGQEYEGDWTVTDHQRPTRVVMEVLGSGTRITYAFSPEGESATRFSRTLAFDPALFAGSAADPSALERLMFAQSQQALTKLKRVVEQSESVGQR